MPEWRTYLCDGCGDQVSGLGSLCVPCYNDRARRRKYEAMDAANREPARAMSSALKYMLTAPEPSVLERRDEAKQDRFAKAMARGMAAAEESGPWCPRCGGTEGAANATICDKCFRETASGRGGNWEATDLMARRFRSERLVQEYTNLADVARDYGTGGDVYKAAEFAFSGGAVALRIGAGIPVEIVATKPQPYVPGRRRVIK